MPELEGVLPKHPHARGEDPEKKDLMNRIKETPPRTWGRRYNLPAIPDKKGNTPTHVGKTAAASSFLAVR